MTELEKNSFSRRDFLGAATAGSIATLAAPAILTAKKTERRLNVGSGDHQYEVLHHWPQLPERFTWQTTHNVAIDSEGLLYVIHNGDQNQPDHDAIFVFDATGKYVRSFGSEFQGGGHGLEVRNEGGQDFIYVTAYKKVRSIAKLDLHGDRVWRMGAPMEAGGYVAGEDKIQHDESTKARDRFHPTNIAFAPDGGFFLADGYGSFRIHRYDKNAQWLSVFGSPGTEDGQFNLPHGLWVDDRGSGEAKLVVSDRANARLQWFTLEGDHLQTLDGFLLPANNDVLGETMVVPDLVGRVTLLDKDNQVIAHLGDDSQRMQAKGSNAIRKEPSMWRDGKFVHPHDACFDTDGNIFIAEWVASGRITKLRKLS